MPGGRAQQQHGPDACEGRVYSGALRRGFPLLTAGIALQLTSVILAILVLRSLQLSQLMPFAALAYVLVPLGALVFKERLTARFWSGAILIALGIAWALPGAARDAYFLHHFARAATFAKRWLCMAVEDNAV